MNKKRKIEMSEEKKQYWMERSHELWKPRHLTEEEKNS